MFSDVSKINGANISKINTKINKQNLNMLIKDEEVDLKFRIHSLHEEVAVKIPEHSLIVLKKLMELLQLMSKNNKMDYEKLKEFCDNIFLFDSHFVEPIQEICTSKLLILNR